LASNSIVFCAATLIVKSSDVTQKINFIS